MKVIRIVSEYILIVAALGNPGLLVAETAYCKIESQLYLHNRSGYLAKTPQHWAVGCGMRNISDTTKEKVILIVSGYTAIIPVTRGMAGSREIGVIL